MAKLINLTTIFMLMCCGNVCLSQLIELSYTYDNYTPNYPSPWHKKLTLIEVLRGPTNFTDWLEMYNFCTSEHSGTHVDAPVHFIKGGKTVDQIQYRNLYRVAGIKIDVTAKTCRNPDYEITSGDLEDWVVQYGELPDGVVILFETGWGKMAHNPEAYSGIDENGTQHFPGVGREASEWMVNYKTRTGQLRGVIGIGVDTASLDVGRTFEEGFPAHVTLLGNDIYGVENMKNLHQLPAGNFTVTMFPIKLGGGSGGPIRAVAEIGGIPYKR